MEDHYDVVIIGAGIIGVTIAYYLSKAHLSCMVLEKETIGCGSSKACGGSVLTQSKPAGPKVHLTLRSMKIFSQLLLEMDFEYCSDGGMVVAETAKEVEFLEKLIEDHRRCGNTLQWMGSQELKERQPYLASHIKGASFSSSDTQLNPIKMTLAMARGAIDHGATIMKKTPALDIVIKNKRVHAVVTEKGAIQCQALVNAAGIDAPKICQMIGLSLPLVSQKGEIMVTNPISAPIIRGRLLTSTYLMSKHGAERDFSIGLAIGQSFDGNILIGSTREPNRYDLSSTWQGLRALAKESTRIFPILKKMKIIRTFSGLRPTSKTGYPLIQPSKRVGGFWVATGHGGDGIALAPVTGEMVMKGLLGNELPDSIPIIDI